MKCKDCKASCSLRAYTDNAECVLQQGMTQEFDWQSFRAEAAKDILCAFSDYFGTSSNEQLVTDAIKLTDELIKQLKEKEN